MFLKIDALKNFVIFTGKHLYSLENTCVRVFSIMLQGWRQETATKVFSCEYCDIFKSSFFHRTRPVDTHRTFLIQTPGDVLWKKFLKNFKRLLGEHLCQSLGPATLLKKRLRTGVFLRIFNNNFFHGARLVAAWNQISLICDNRFCQLLKVLLFATFNFRRI